MTGGHLVLEVVASLRYETPSLVLSVRTLPGLERSDPRGASTDNSMRVSRWASKELRKLWYVSIADSHENTAGEVHTLFLPELSEGQLVCNGMSATSSAAPGRRKVAVMSWIQCARASLSKESGQDLRESLEA